VGRVLRGAVERVWCGRGGVALRYPLRARRRAVPVKRLALRLSAEEARFHAGALFGKTRLPVELVVGWEKDAREPQHAIARRPRVL